MNAAQKAKIFMGGEWGSSLAMATFLAGLAQGCPLSALVFCLTVQLRIALVVQHTTPVDSDAGPLSQVPYMDDVIYLPDTLREFRRMVGRLAPAGIQTHMHSSPLKAHGVAVIKQATAIQFQNPEIVFGGGPLHMMQPNDYIWLVGRHALPHVFHREDYIKLLSACRRASLALRQLKLPSHYPVLMYNAAGGGMQRWMSGVRPPAYGTHRVCDHAAASVIRSITRWHTLASAHFLQSITAGWTGVLPATVVMTTHFLLTYIKQLGHHNHLVRDSVTKGLWRAVHRFYPLMACVREVFPKKCGAHDTYHDKVVALLYHLGITLLFPDYVRTTEKDHTMAACIHDWQVYQTHSWMDCGHYTLSQAVHALWPVPQWMHDLPPPRISTLPQVKATWPQFRDIPVRPIFITDGA